MLLFTRLITLIAGGNDVIQDYYRMDDAIGRLGALIRQVSSDAPDVTVLVAGTQPFRDAGTDARGEAFTAEIPIRSQPARWRPC